MSSRLLIVILALAPALLAAPIEVDKLSDLLKKGAALSAPEAAKLEDRLNKKPDDPAARIQLLSYYATIPPALEIAAIKTARAKHVFWLIESDPKNGHGLFSVGTRVYRINCQGDRLASPEDGKKAASLWLAQHRKKPTESNIRQRAISASYCDPDEAQRLLADTGDAAGLGTLYANAILGVSGLSYDSDEPSGSDAALRQGPFAETARKALAATTGKDTLQAAAVAMLRNGANLWADGKLDWDYTQFGKTLLVRARNSGANDISLATLPTTLPASGERPPITVRVGGNIQAANIENMVRPVYPLNAKNAGIQGTVRFDAIVGLDGAIVGLRVVSGPAQLIPASVESVRQWRYKPTTLNGKPCYVITQIDVNFTLN